MKEPLGLWLKVDASRGQNDPRNPAEKALESMARFRSKSGRDHSREGSVNGTQPEAKPPAGECGVKDQVSQAVLSLLLKGKRL